ncbi:MAG TPA: glycosyltransferase family 2 protein [Mobilitalea sp.]|nr:glycosyltransferase family 2 protein [Mobilitalea sp.]
MVTISVCMIVKNEAEVLGRCLDTLAVFAEEIIIVDTGSSDDTKQVAARYTDKIFDFTWIDDFAAARNYSLDKATMDYIYVADADEVIDEENRERFRILKQTLLPEIDIVQMRYANQLEHNTTYNFDVEYRPKLYKRLRSFRFTDPVHESVILSPVIYDSEITIKHMPQDNHAARDFSIFMRVIQREGKLSTKLYEMYARELFIAGAEKDFLEAASYYQSFADKEDCSERERRIYECVLTRICRLKKDTTGLMKYSLKNIAGGKASSEVCYELGEFYYQEEDYKEALLWYYNAAYETECDLNIRYAGDYPLNRLARCYHLLGDRVQEEAYQALSAAWSKENMR